MIHVRSLSAAVLALLAAACPTRGDDAVLRTTFVLREIATGLDTHHERAGSLPASISEVCNSSSGCVPSFPPNARLEDAWGRGIIYTRTEQSYLLRSPGRDGRPGTGDDLTISPELEHSRRDAFAGCHQLGSSGADVPKFVKLDTIETAPGSALYGVQLDRESGLGWFPMTDETVAIMRFDGQHSTTVIELTNAPAGLTGHRFRRGVPPVDVLATRVPCAGTQ